MRLIGITGYKRSGKDTTFHIVKELLESGLITQRVGFADKVKLAAAHSLGIQGSDADLIAAMDDFKENGEVRIGIDPQRHTPYMLSGREFLQNLGVKHRLLFGENFWVDQVLPEPNGHPSRDSRACSNALNLRERYPTVNVLCITDTRFTNEAIRILRLGGEIWRITRPGVESDGHDSEQRMPDAYVTHEINNDGTLEDLREQVKGALSADH